MLRAYQSPASTADCGPQCAQIPNFASLNHSGISYARSDARVPSKGPSANPRLPSAKPRRDPSATPNNPRPDPTAAPNNPFLIKSLLDIDIAECTNFIATKPPSCPSDRF